MSLFVKYLSRPKIMLIWHFYSRNEHALTVFMYKQQPNVTVTVTIIVLILHSTVSGLEQSVMTGTVYRQINNIYFVNMTSVSHFKVSVNDYISA